MNSSCWKQRVAPIAAQARSRHCERSHHLAGLPAQNHDLLIPVSCDAQAIVGASPFADPFGNVTRGLARCSSCRHFLSSSIESCGSASLQFALDLGFQDVMSNKAVNPSGGSGGFWNQRFLAAAGLPQSFAMTGNTPWKRPPPNALTAPHRTLLAVICIHAFRSGSSPGRAERLNGVRRIDD